MAAPAPIAATMAIPMGVLPITTAIAAPKAAPAAARPILVRPSCDPFVPSSKLIPLSSKRLSRIPTLLADRAFHLELAQPVQLDRVLERQLLGYRLDKTVDHHRHRGPL